MNFKLKIITVIFLTLAISVPLYSGESWKLVKSKGSINVYTKPIPGSKFKEFKGVAYINASMEKINKIIDNISGLTKWMPNCIISKTIKKNSENHIILYQELKSPWPVSNRDFVVESFIKKTPGKIIRTLKAINYPAVPVKKGKIRITDMKGRWILTKKGDNKTLVVYQVKSNPGGTLPASIANLASKDLPYKAIQGLRNMAQ